MPSCCVFNCTNPYGKSSYAPSSHLNFEKVYLYSFPKRDKSPQRHKLWCNKVWRGDGFKPNHNTRICSSHFKLDDFEESAIRQIQLKYRTLHPPLKRSAVPSLYLRGEKEECVKKERKTKHLAKKVIRELLDSPAPPVRSRKSRATSGHPDSIAPRSPTESQITTSADSVTNNSESQVLGLPSNSVSIEIQCDFGTETLASVLSWTGEQRRSCSRCSDLARRSHGRFKARTWKYVVGFRWPIVLMKICTKMEMSLVMITIAGAGENCQHFQAWVLRCNLWNGHYAYQVNTDSSWRQTWPLEVA